MRLRSAVDHVTVTEMSPLFQLRCLTGDQLEAHHESIISVCAALCIGVLASLCGTAIPAGS
jgi:hypothetical protein